MINVENIVRLWHKTQVGHHLECRKAQSELSDIMWKLFDKLERKGTLSTEQQCIGDEVI